MKKGFTLIELVMVIVIISILAAIAIPKFIDLQDNAKRAADNGSLATVRSALAAYYAKTAISGSASFPTTLHTSSFVSDYFASATLPTLQYYNSYSYSSSDGLVELIGAQ